MFISRWGRLKRAREAGCTIRPTLCVCFNLSLVLPYAASFKLSGWEERNLKLKKI